MKISKIHVQSVSSADALSEESGQGLEGKRTKVTVQLQEELTTLIKISSPKYSACLLRLDEADSVLQRANHIATTS